MSTRSAIGFISDLGTFEAIYCHYDGYPGHVGKILVEHYCSMGAAFGIINGPQIRNFDHDGTICRFGDGDGTVESYESVEEALNNGFDYAYVYDAEQLRWICYGKDYNPMFQVREFDIPGNEVVA